MGSRLCCFRENPETSSLSIEHYDIVHDIFRDWQQRRDVMETIAREQKTAQQSKQFFFFFFHLITVHRTWTWRDKIALINVVMRRNHWLGWNLWFCDLLGWALLRMLPWLFLACVPGSATILQAEHASVSTPYLCKFTPEAYVVYFGGLCTVVGREVDQQASHTIELGNSKKNNSVP